ncbi:MAG: DUF1302 domain-containing protein [Desulfuromonadales bacterium]|nr:DUF1302 domain-containing protein [Desulfuromonadales bacterium]
MNLHGLKSHGRLGVVLPVLLAMLWGAPVSAFQFNLGEVNGSFDSTLSYGLSWRVADRDKNLIGLQEGGRAYSHNYDDGNLNYDQGELISNTAKITSELALDYRNFGLFVRGSAFYDFENMDQDRERTELSDEALDLVGKDAELLDAYLWWNFHAGDMPGQLRVGDQVLSWGESTFIQNGINVINPFDVSKLRVPGAELKEGLVPVGMVSASISPTENLTFEAFYQYDWEQVEIDPTGSYWSTNDFAGDGGEKVMLGFGDFSDMGDRPVADTLLGVPRAPDIYADNDGQYGIAMRVYAPGLNDTEFGFYFMNYHSRLPVISSWTGNSAGFAAATPAANAVAADAGVIIPTAVGTWANVLVTSGFSDEQGAYAEGVVAGTDAVNQASSMAGEALAIKTLDVATSAYSAAGGGAAGLAAAQAAVGANAVALTTGIARAAAQDAYAKTARYQIEYPEDIKLFGMSFNTVLPSTGVALQGEISHRQDVPLQVDDLELLLATLEPLTILSGTGSPLANAPLDPTYSQLGTVTPFDINVANGGSSVYIAGYELLDVTQAQTTATKLFGPIFGADQFTMVGEVGVTHVHNMPSKSELRFDGPGTPVSGNPNHANPAYPLAAHPGKPAEPSGAFADATSWGYRLVGKLDFNDAIGAVTLSPRIAWSHDVDGTTPGPGGNFVEHRKAITIGIGADYQNTWAADLSYTDFFGADRYNLINDRDFVAFNIKYSF